MAKYLTLNKQNPLFTHGWRLAPLFSSLSHHRQAQRHWASLVPRSNPQVSTCLSPPQELFCLGHWWLLTWRGQGHPQSSSYLTSLQRSVMWDQSLSFLKISLGFSMVSLPRLWVLLDRLFLLLLPRYRMGSIEPSSLPLPPALLTWSATKPDPPSLLRTTWIFSVHPLPTDVTLIWACVFSHLDYCNSFLPCSILHMLPPPKAFKHKSDHFPPLLKFPSWHPIIFRIKPKLLSMACPKSLRN